MANFCPKCNHNIPEGNPNCNICGFEFEKYLKAQTQKTNKKPNSNPASVVVTLISIIFFGFVYFIIEKPYLITKYFSPEYLNPETIFEMMEYFPFIITGLILIIFTVSILSIKLSRKK